MFASKGENKKIPEQNHSKSKRMTLEGVNYENFDEPYQRSKKSQRFANRHQKRQNRVRQNVPYQQISISFWRANDRQSQPQKRGFAGSPFVVQILCV